MMKDTKVEEARPIQVAKTRRVKEKKHLLIYTQEGHSQPTPANKFSEQK
jgi:hypothetical protein